MSNERLNETHLAALDRLLPRYGLRRTASPQPVSTGTLNRNFRVPVEGGSPEARTVFARCYRGDLEPDRLRREHAITRWVEERGIPAVAPLPTIDGDTVVELDGECWAIFPWVDGRNPIRGEITAREAEALGDAHGRVQQALAAHRESQGATLGEQGSRLAWDTRNAIALLDRIENAAPAELRDALAFRRELLESSEPRPSSDFGSLPCQLLHGDFHDQQVLLGPDGSAAGIVDWELTAVAARVWELIRSLSFSELLETDGLEDYLRGFGRHVRLTERECHDGLELWWQTRLHSAWVYEAYLLEGNERVAPFLATTDAHLRRLADKHRREAIAGRLVASLA